MAPLLAGSKMCAPSRRSAPRASNAEASTGNAIRTMIEVIRMVQVNNGIRNIVMPGARRQMIVVMKLTPPRICLLYTSDAADDLTRVDLGGRRIIKKKKKNKITKNQ